MVRLGDGARHRHSPARPCFLFLVTLFALSCGAGDDGATPTAPTAPTAAPRELIGLEIFAERTAIRVGQVVGPLAAYGRYDDGTTGEVSATWSSSDPTAVGVAEDATVTGVSAGAAELSATFESFAATVNFEVEEPNPRTTRDQPDDFTGPQIHAVYALPGDVEDGNLDRYGDIARSFEAIQNWLSEEIGYRLRLDTFGGEVDVTFLRLPLTDQEGEDPSSFVSNDLEQAIADAIGIAPDKTYAVYYAGRSAGVCGSAPLGGRSAAVFVHGEGCSNSSPGMDPEVASTYEAMMVHELLHAFGAVSSCAPNYVEGSHVSDDPEDLMYSGVERGVRSGAAIDAARDDYFGQGREDCFDTADSLFWEKVEFRRPASRGPQSSRVQIPMVDWPLRCGLH